MDERTVERIFTSGYEAGIINLASELGLIDERVTERQAWKMYGKRQVIEWRKKRWIVGYPTGNKSIRKFYYKRSELETASRMLDVNNAIQPTKIKQLLDLARKDI